jgi:hypothetical protein
MNDTTQPRYPLYIVSKSRWESRLTDRTLHDMNIPHYIIVEESERASYAAVVSPTATLLTLDTKYQHDYDTCDDLGSSKSKGPGPARNFAWEHSVAQGHAWHWVMDDNIRGFWRLFRNSKIRFGDGTPFCAMEDFVDRYSNMAMAGPNYYMFAPRKVKIGAYVMNTRIYSCNLIRNDTPYRWRGRYNEDTDLSLRMLKDGWCTIQFYAFLQNKIATQRMKGGNTAVFYTGEGTKPKSEMLVKLHPDVSRLVWKWNRWHHHVDYRPFEANKLILRPGVVIQEVNNYGLELIEMQSDEQANEPDFADSDSVMDASEEDDLDLFSDGLLPVDDLFDDLERKVQA